VADADARVVDGAVGGCVHPVVAAACAGGWCRIPAGCFTMGSPASEPCRRTSEDAHQVTLTREFEIQRTEVTQAEFQLRMGYNPSSLDGMNCGASCPVQRVNKHEAMAYCNAQSVAAGKVACYSCTGTGAGVTCLHAAAFGAEQIYGCPGYRLPTDAEWEYAYRAGTTTAYPSGANDATKCTTCSEVDPNADSIGWYCANYANLPSHPSRRSRRTRGASTTWRATSSSGVTTRSSSLWEPPPRPIRGTAVPATTPSAAGTTDPTPPRCERRRGKAGSRPPGSTASGSVAHVRSTESGGSALLAQTSKPRSRRLKWCNYIAKRRHGSSFKSWL